MSTHTIHSLPSSGLSALPQVSVHNQPNDVAVPWTLGPGSTDHASAHTGRLWRIAQSVAE